MSPSVKKIFVVDDDEMLSMMLEDHLSQNRDYSIKCFATGEDCLKQLNENPDVVILDFNLDSLYPHARNGIEILQQIKKAHNGIQVIMYSSQNQYGEALEIIGEAAVEYIIKDKDTFSKIDKILETL